MSKTILIVDDHANIRDVVKFAIEKEGFRAIEARNGREALDQFSAHSPDLVVLDIMMPELNGTEVCQEIRKTSQTPIIFLSSRDEELDRILGLELGGDDYLTKPFSPRELVVRIKAVLRRAQPNQEPRPPEGEEKKVIEYDQLKLDSVEYKVFWATQEIVLTVTEFGLLKTLLSYPGKVYSRDELIDRVYDGLSVSHRTVDSHVRRIRSKLSSVGGDLIETVHGVGYKIRK